MQKLKMNLTIVTLDITLKGGIERVISNKSNILIDYRDITIISILKTNKEPSYSIDNRVKIIYLSSLNTKNYRIKTLILMPKLIKALSNVDNVISMFPLISIPLSFTKYRKKLIASEHSEYFSQSKLVTFLRKFSYNRIKTVVTLTESGVKNFKKDGVKSTLIPNFINLPSNVNINTDKPYKIIFVGRFEKVKNPFFFVELAKEMKNHKEFHFEMYGDGILKEEIIKKADKLNNLTINSFSNSIEKVYEKSDALIIPSHTEAFPMVVVEAISYGLVIYGFKNQVGTSEILGGVTNNLLNFNDVKSMKKNIIKDFKDYSNLKKMKSIHIQLSKKYCSDYIIKDWLKII